MTNDPELRAEVTLLEAQLALLKQKLAPKELLLLGEFYFNDYAERLWKGSALLKEVDALIRKIINLQCEDVHFVVL